MNRKLLLSIVFIFYCSLAALPQDLVRKITGTVRDNEGQTLPGVSIKIKGTNLGTSTGADGSYSIAVSPGATLVFTYIGFQSREIQVNENAVINVVLITESRQLNEVVVVGYGTQRKGDITGAVGTVSSEALESRPNTQFGNLIQGKTAGVQVQASSGNPTEAISIRIRGTNSISAGSDPLYVVDGVPTTDTRSLNPGDIESLSVLKDASSAAIYGAQGANGVVLITTKKGKSGAPKIELGTYAGFSSVWKQLDLLSGAQYHDLMTELGYNTDWTQYTANTDWQDEIFRKGSSQNYQVSLSGKNDKTTYYLSGGWVQQKGAVRSAEMDRYNFKINLDQKVNNWLNAGANLAYTRYHDVDITDNTNVNGGGVLLGVLSTPPIIGIYNSNGQFTSNPFQDWENPVASTDGSDRGYKNQRILGNAYGEAFILPELKLRSSIGIDYGNAAYDYFLDPIRTSNGRARGGIGRYQTWLTNYWISDNTLTYTKSIEKHNFSALAGFVAQKYRWENSSIERQNFSGTAVTTPNAGAVIQTANADKTEKANQSAIARLTYDFSGKYLFTANFRADASSNFGPGNKWGYFPSFSAGWRLSEEQFLKDISAISDLKIRAGWGIVGNDNIGTYAYFGRVGVGANYPIGGVVQPGSYPSTIQNDDLKWEETRQTNVGIDLSLFNSRITFSADAYHKKTTDLLLNVPLPKSTGFDTGIQNAGSLQNRGLEFQLNTRNFVKKDFQWETDLNISFNRNKVLNIVGQEVYGGGVSGRDDVSLTKEGQQIGLFYGYVTDIVDPQTGNQLYLDMNGNSTTTPAAADKRVIGNPNPDFIYGITNTLNFKKFGLNIFLQGSQGNDIFNASRIETEGMTDPKNQSAAVLNRWTTTGQVTDIPRATANSISNSRASSRFVEDGSYLRIKAATLSYNLPAAVLSRLRMGSARLYVTGENLITFTGYKGFDPEVNFAGASNTTLGIDYGTYPQTRNLIFGLNVSF